MAFEVAADILTPILKSSHSAETYSNKNIKRLYQNLNSETEKIYCYSEAFHISLCSVFGVDFLTRICKDDNTLMLHIPHKELCKFIFKSF